MKNNFLSKAVPLGTRTIWRYLSALFILFTFAIGNVWAEDFTITPINGSYLSPGNLVKITYSGDLKTSSTQIQTTEKNKSGVITLTTIAPGVYLKSASFTDANWSSATKRATLECTSGGSIVGVDGVYTFTASANATTATISITAGTSGAAKLGSVSLVVTNGTTNDIETYSTFAKTDDNFSFTAKCNGTSITPAAALSSSTWTVSSNNISAPSSNDSKTITVSSANNIKFIAFYDSNCRLSIVEKSSSGGTCDGASWSVGSSPTKSVTFKNGISTSLTITKVFVITEAASKHTVTYDLNGATGTTPTQADVAEGAKFTLHNGTTGITAPANKAFAGWNDGTTTYAGGAEYTMGTSDVTLTAQWSDSYSVTYVLNGPSGDAPTEANKAGGAKFSLAAAPTYAGYRFMGWNDGTDTYAAEAEYTMPSDNVTLTAQWSALYAIATGTPDNGTVAAGVDEAIAGEEVTVTATPATNYMLSAWDVYKTGESSTKVSVANGKFTMPAYAVTVNATFVADTRKKVLYVTSTAEATVKENDKLYDALKDIYNVSIVGPTSEADQTNYDLVVLHESIGGSSYNAAAVAAAKTGSTPVLNTKSYFYNDGRFGWGAPNAGQSVKGATQNSAYCNIADHPLFSGVTVTDGFFEITDDAAAKCMQPVGSFTSGKEGYTLATTPNNGEGNGCAIHELTPAQRGASAGKYLMISVSNDKLNALNANGQKLFQNAAAYLVDGSASWAPISVPTAAEVTATPSENYTEGNTITLTASATGTTASTTYTWYKGADWATASATTPVQAAATDGNVFTKTAALEDAGTYWCNISNGTSCDVQASVTITVSSASTPTHAIIYDNTKGADMTAYPTEYTEGVGVASFAALADIDGWHFVEWSPASIAADATTDQTITAVWAQVFEVTFDLQGHGAAIAAQNIVSGGKVTKPDDPIAIGWDFGGWFTDAVCTAGNEWDFDNDVVSAATPLFAKWTEFDGCALLVPATSGAAPAVGDAIVMQTGSKGGSMSVVGTPLSYNDPYGLGFDSNASAKAKVTLNNEIQENTVITLTLVANGESARGLHIYSGDGATKITSLGWGSTIAKYTEATFTYTVQSTDVALIGSNEFQLWRNNSVWLKKLAVTACGDPVVFHNLTSAITPDHDPAYATVTLDASSVREGYTTKATYSAIDAGYEFDEWQISGTGASIADASANPAVITMGTTDAVITLKLKVATPKHTVTFNKMGKGDDVPSQLVAEGALVSEPSVAEPEGWMLEGWYKESTLENKWDFASDVMSTSDIELFANWVTDTSIKLINKSTGAINTTNFATAVAAEADVDGEKGASFSSARTAVTSISALGEMVQYNATTNQTKIQLSMYNTSTNQKTIYLFKVAEGDDAADVTEITIDGSSRKTTEYITFNSDKNRSFYVTVSDAKVKILQVKVVDDGTTPMKQFGQAGYSLNLNKGRVFAKNDGSAYPFEGGAIKVSSDYKVLNNSNLATKSYIQFNNAVANTILKVTRSGGNYYVSQDPEDKGTAYNKDEEIVLPAAGTWYLGSTSTGSSASFTKVEFLAPKCAEPAFNALTNSDICSGDPYVALDGTATVADLGTPTYQWYREDDTEITGETNATYTPTADGKYYVIAINHLAGFSDNEKKSDLVTVTTYASAVITTAPLNKRGEVDDVVTLTVAASGKNVAYKWYTCDEDGSNEEAIVPEQTGTSLDVTITAGMAQWYKVKVTSDCGGAEAKAKVTEFQPTTPATVGASILWDWTSSAWPASGTIEFSDQTAEASYELLADADAAVPNNEGFRSDMLYGKGQYVWRSSDPFFQGSAIKFTSTVAGMVRVYFRSTKSGRTVNVAINGTDAGSRTNSFDWSEYVEVPAGEVEILCTGDGYTRIQKIEFYQYDTKRDDSWIAPGELGTICYPNGHVVLGAEIYEMAGVDEYNKFVFDEVQQTEPGKPYLFIANSYDPIKFFKTTAAAEASPINHNGMVGTFNELIIPNTTANTYYFSGTKFYAVNKRTTDLTVPANRAYVDLNEPHPALAPKAGVRRITFDVQGTESTQGFENLQTGDQPMKVMIEGQLYILRGEKVYDATGRLVK